VRPHITASVPLFFLSLCAVTSFRRLMRCSKNPNLATDSFHVMSIVRGKCLRAFGRLRSTVMACAAELATGHWHCHRQCWLSQQGSTTRGAPAGAVSRKQSSHWWCYVSAVKLYGSHQQRMSTPIASS
jgi:hypothetical protein